MMIIPLSIVYIVYISGLKSACDAFQEVHKGTTISISNKPKAHAYTLAYIRREKESENKNVHRHPNEQA